MEFNSGFKGLMLCVLGSDRERRHLFVGRGSKNGRFKLSELI